mmetsp:Transcript_7649/g.11508  ORF Transcript_7649/g.11508 Transcript_7649/m.11508 type:complete len:264 (+) Transcript_7649:3399-4190(+)
MLELLVESPPTTRICWWRVLAPKMLSVLSATFFFGFALFQKKILPPKIAAIAARIYFAPTLPLTYLRLSFIPPRAGIWTELDDTVIIGAAPINRFGMNHPKKLRELGVCGVINCCAEYQGPDWQSQGIELLRLPTIDHQEPTTEDLIKAVHFIQSLHDKGQKCYVHCKAGHGRSAAVSLSWLMHRHYGQVAPFDLYRKMATKRKIRKNLYRQPNIISFYQSLPLSHQNNLSIQDHDAQEKDEKFTNTDFVQTFSSSSGTSLRQ